MNGIAENDIAHDIASMLKGGIDDLELLGTPSSPTNTDFTNNDDDLSFDGLGADNVPNSQIDVPATGDGDVFPSSQVEDTLPTDCPAPLGPGEDRPLVPSDKVPLIIASNTPDSQVKFTSSPNCHGAMIRARFCEGHELRVKSVAEVCKKLNTINDSIAGHHIEGGGVRDAPCLNLSREHPKRIIGKRGNHPGKPYSCCYRHLKVEVPCIVGPPGKEEKVTVPIQWCDNFSGGCKMSPWHLAPGFEGAPKWTKELCYFERPRGKNGTAHTSAPGEEPPRKKGKPSPCRCGEIFGSAIGDKCLYPRCIKCSSVGCGRSKEEAEAEAKEATAADLLAQLNNVIASASKMSEEQLAKLRANPEVLDRFQHLYMLVKLASDAKPALEELTQDSKPALAATPRPANCSSTTVALSSSVQPVLAATRATTRVGVAPKPMCVTPTPTPPRPAAARQAANAKASTAAQTLIKMQLMPTVRALVDELRAKFNLPPP